VRISTFLVFHLFLLKRTTQVQDNSFEILDVGGMLSGVSAAGYTFGLPATFNFNGAKYDVSTRKFRFQVT
jgi:hypothetical protein